MLAVVVVTLLGRELKNKVERFKTTYEIMKEGTGDQVVLMGDHVSVHAVGRITTRHIKYQILPFPDARTHERRSMAHPYVSHVI